MTTVESPSVAACATVRPGAATRRGRYIVAIGGCVVAVVAIVVLAVVLSENVVYFRTVTEAVHNREDEGTSRFRLAGAVRRRHGRTRRRNGVTLRGHRRQEHGRSCTTTVTRPTLFKEGAPVVCEGHWASTASNAPFSPIAS